jgi:hypothetical protein
MLAVYGAATIFEASIVSDFNTRGTLPLTSQPAGLSSGNTRWNFLLTSTFGKVSSEVVLALGAAPCPCLRSTTHRRIFSVAPTFVRPLEVGVGPPLGGHADHR